MRICETVLRMPGPVKEGEKLLQALEQIPLQTIVQGGAHIHLQPVQSDVFPFPFLQEAKKTAKQPKNYIKVIIFLLSVNKVKLCQGSDGLGNKGTREFYLCFSFFLFFFLSSSLFYLPHKEL